MEDVEVLKCLKMKRPTFKVGSVGPYNIQINSLTTLVEDDKVSDEVMDSICDVLSRIRPGVVHINSQALTKILDGSKRAKSHYFIKNNIFEGTTEVFGPYLEGGNHWTFFHCNVDKRCITYFNSFGEIEWQCQAIAQHWCDFATARGVQGEWVLKTTKHSLQTDSVSCGVHTLAFATEFIKSGGCITSFQCPAIQQERYLPCLAFVPVFRPNQNMWNLFQKCVGEKKSNMHLWGSAAFTVCSHTCVLHMPR
nr:uncharacterized protein LOC129419846 isoform X1 [Misgurnus anguillicaudatus]XP_055031012.1 uncharacterized protein LOC129419846 isoform X1 [Misgurnus anguillicaudatus]